MKAILLLFLLTFLSVTSTAGLFKFVAKPVGYMAVKKTLPFILKSYGKKQARNTELKLINFVLKNPKTKDGFIKRIDKLVAKNPSYKYNAELFKKRIQDVAPQMAHNSMRIAQNGKWSGSVGNSRFYPTSMPDGSKYALKDLQKMIQKDGGIPYNKGYPNLTKYALKKKEIKGMTGDHASDVSLAKKVFVKDFKNMKALDKYVKDNDLAYHHEADGLTMSLIKNILHESVKHEGEASVLRGGIP